MLVFGGVTKIDSGWWLYQPIWKNMLVKMGIISPGIGVNIENNWNHPPSDGYELANT